MMFASHMQTRPRHELEPWHRMRVVSGLAQTARQQGPRPSPHPRKGALLSASPPKTRDEALGPFAFPELTRAALDANKAPAVQPEQQDRG